MDISNLAPRVELSPASTAPSLRVAPDALSAAPETARPVLAAEASGKTSASQDEGFQPLDTYEVGDNDHVPVPPEPPRESTLLALIDAGPGDEAPENVPEAATSPRPAPSPEVPPAAALEETLRNIDAGPANPTVDIRR